MTSSWIGTFRTGAGDRPFPGILRRSFDTDEATVVSYQFEAGASFPLHRHAEEQITFVEEGEIEFRLAGESRRLAPLPQGAVTAFAEFSERAGDFALASVCVGAAFWDGRCSWARVGLGGVGPTPVRVPEAEQILLGGDLGEEPVGEAARVAAAACDPAGDFHASATFRKELVATLARNALSRLGNVLRTP